MYPEHCRVLRLFTVRLCALLDLIGFQLLLILPLHPLIALLIGRLILIRPLILPQPQTTHHLCQD